MAPILSRPQCVKGTDVQPMLDLRCKVNVNNPDPLGMPTSRTHGTVPVSPNMQGHRLYQQ